MSRTKRSIVTVAGSITLLVAGSVAAAPSASSPPGPAASAPPASATPPAALPAAPAAPLPAAAPQVSVSGARGSIERNISELGNLLLRARQSGNMTRVACVQDKRDRADSVLEVATGEILVLQDPAVDAQSRAFAGEKLSEAAGRLSGLVNQARACQGGGDEDKSSSENQANQPKSVIPNDPTSTVPSVPRLPPRIDPRPPVASPVL